MDDFDIKVLELKIQNLISKRQLVVSILVVLIGGIVGLAFMSNGILKSIFITAGTIYAVVLVNEFLIINSKIEKLLNYAWKRG